MSVYVGNVNIAKIQMLVFDDPLMTNDVETHIKMRVITEDHLFPAIFGLSNQSP